MRKDGYDSTVNTRADDRSEIFECIEIFYKRQWAHSLLRYETQRLYHYLAARRDGPPSMLAFEPSMDDSHQASAEKVRSLIERGSHDRGMFRAALLSVPPAIRDGWLDVVFGLGDLPNDGPELPRGCVPYVPSSVDALLRVVQQAPVRASDIFVDVGSGLGRAAALVHLLTGAAVIGIEIQPHLIIGARDLAARLLLSRIFSVEGDAAKLAGYIPIGTVFFLYCPFGGERLARVLGDLEHIARTRELRVCCIDLPLPPCSWLTLDPPLAGDLAIYRSTLFDGTFGRRTAQFSIP